MSNIEKIEFVILMSVIVLPTFQFNQLVYSQQININRIDQMPNIPEPYEMRNWEEVMAGYDSLVFDFSQTGQYLPLIWLRTNTVNYAHVSFGLHTVVGTTSPTLKHQFINFSTSYVVPTSAFIRAARKTP